MFDIDKKKTARNARNFFKRLPEIIYISGHKISYITSPNLSSPNVTFTRTNTQENKIVEDLTRQEKAQQYIDQVKKVLDTLEKEERELIIDSYVKNEPDSKLTYDFGCSISTLSNRKNKALVAFSLVWDAQEGGSLTVFK